MKRLLFAILFSFSCFAQQVPDCIIQLFNVTATGASAPFDNRGFNCTTWTLTAEFQGFSAASAELDSAPDANGSAGTFTLFAGTVVTGSNPITVFTQKSGIATFNGFFPWLQLNVTSLTGSGTIKVTAYGFRPTPVITTSSGGSSPCAGTSATPCIVAGPDAQGVTPTQSPVQQAVVDGAGKVIVPTQCTSFFTFDTSAAGNTLLVAASGSTKVRLCEFSAIDVGTGNTFQLKQGTGATCAGGTTNLWMIYTNVLAVSQDWVGSPLTTSASNSVCINLTNATRVVGAITYAQY